MGSLLLFLVLVAIYFLPSFVAYEKSFGTQVFVLNFFLGWTFIGWVIALVWALRVEKQ